LESALISKNEKFSIGCINKTKNGNCRIILSKKYSDGNQKQKHICFDRSCQFCEEISTEAYNKLNPDHHYASPVSDCEIVYDKTYYDYPGSGILTINITDDNYVFDVYEKAQDSG